MRYFALLSSMTLVLNSHLLYSDTLSDKIDNLIAQQLPHASIGIVIKNAQTDKIIYSKNADKLLSPASSIKLFTAAAALYQLKPEFRFKTTLLKKDKDYYLKFSGSPSLRDKNLSDLILNVKKNSSLIEGNIVLDTQKFVAPNYPGGVSYDDMGWYYAAPTTTVILNENAVAYDFITAKELGKPVIIKAKSPNQALTIINDVLTVSKEEAKDHCDLNIKIKPHNTVHIFGCLAQSKDPKSMMLAIPNPGAYARHLIKDTLQKNDMVLQGRILKGTTPSDAQLIAEYQSPPLSKLITHMLKESDNLYGNSLTKELGFNLLGKGSHKQGMYALKKALFEHTHVDKNQVELADGIGTRYNLVTPTQMVVLLSDLYHDTALQPIIFQALPLAGTSGTLNFRMRKTKLEKKVWAKTGTMHDISSLSGYLKASDGNTYIFSIIINGINKPINQAKKLEEQILLAIEEA